MGLISIVTINFNNLNGLKKTINSVLQQTAQEIEYIVIDGGSTDGSKAFIESVSNKLNYWVSEPDRGIYHAMNKGIEKANGEYVLFLNSGDALNHANTIEMAIPYLKNEGLIQFQMQLENDAKDVLLFPEKLSLAFLLRTSLGHQSMFISRKHFEMYGLYNETYKIASDWIWYFTLFYRNQLTYKYVPQVVVTFDTGGISNQNKNLSSSERRQFIETFNPKLLHDIELIESRRSQFHRLRNSVWIKLLLKLNLIERKLLNDSDL